MHPKARCGQCSACQYVESTKSIVLAHSAPAGPGITQREADLWNETLERNPCEQPLILVHHNHETVEGRVIVGDMNSDPDTIITVETVRFGRLNVQNRACTDWTPTSWTELINFEELAAGLRSMPMTFYPQLLSTIVEAAYAKETFVNGGASRTAANVEERIGRAAVTVKPGEELKYLIAKNPDDKEYALVFPKNLNHVDIARFHRASNVRVVAGGFCTLLPEVVTWGKAESIPMDGRPEDVAIIKASFGK